jgi:hypothetical protein
MVWAHVVTCKPLLENLVNMYVLAAVKRSRNGRNVKGTHEIKQRSLPENSECINVQISVVVDINSKLIFSCCLSIPGLHAQLFLLLQETSIIFTIYILSQWNV